MNLRSRGWRAFSLVEVVLALGVAAFSLIAVFALLPVGVQTNRNAISQTAATNIMAAVVSDLRATPKTSGTSSQFGITISTDPTRGVATTCQPCFDCWQAQTQTFYFDGAGQSVAAANSRYRLTVTSVQNPTATTTSGATFADLKVTWPAVVDPCTTTPSGSVEMFAALDRN